MADETNNNSTEEGAVVVVEESAPIAYRYDSSKNTTGGFFPGVPKASLTQEQYDRLPKHLQRSIAASPMYVATATATAKPKDKDKEEGATPNKPKANSKAKE